jgi:VanZ family protein
MRHIKNLLAPKFLFFLALSFTLLITFGSLISSSSIPKIKFAVSDKLIHAVGYFVLMFLWALFVLSKYRSSSFLKRIFITASLTFIYGIVIEVLQGTLTKTRTTDIYDVLANGLGIMIAVFVLVFFQSNLIKLKSKN